MTESNLTSIGDCLDQIWKKSVQTQESLEKAMKELEKEKAKNEVLQQEVQRLEAKILSKSRANEGQVITLRKLLQKKTDQLFRRQRAHAASTNFFRSQINARDLADTLSSTQISTATTQFGTPFNANSRVPESDSFPVD